MVIFQEDRIGENDIPLKESGTVLGDDEENELFVIRKQVLVLCQNNWESKFCKRCV